MADDATMEVPPEQRNLQRNLNMIAAQGVASAAADSMMIDDEDDGNNERDGGDEREGADGRVSSDPWYMRTFWNLGRSSTPSRTAASWSSSSNDDCREEAMDTEREGGDDYGYDERIHEPLKRQQEEEGQGNKRRRVGEAASRAFYTSVPALTERQQAIVEYSAPSVFTPLFYFLGYTPFGIAWVALMYVGHFIQTALSTFGDETEDLRWKAWITPLYHHLMDTYLWNHSMITAMLLFPDWYGSTAYWLAVFFTMGQQQCYLVVSLKTHIVKHRHTLTAHGREQMELHLVDTFLMYAIAAFTFTVARIYSMPYLLWIGLVEFNLAPLYLVWNHKKRMDAGKKPMKKKQQGDKKEEAAKQGDTEKDKDADAKEKESKKDQ